MSEHQNLPPRPRKIPPHILRRRRIVAVVILLILLGLLAWGIWALIGLFTSGDEGAPESPPTVTETVSPSPSPSETEEDDDEDDEDSASACDPEFLTVVGETDQESYAEDEFPVFAMTVTHDGDVLCDASLGSDQQDFVVEDADGQFVFSTSACQVEPQEQIVEMEPGQSELAEFEWERVGTDEDCETIVEDVDLDAFREAGEAAYEALGLVEARDQVHQEVRGQ